MRPWLCAGVFLSVFAIGMAVCLFMRGFSGRGTGAPSMDGLRVSEYKATPVARGLEALVLPPNAVSERCSEGSWEAAGDIGSNYVTAREQFRNCLERQGWVLSGTCVLSESVKPQMLLTYRQGGMDLILMIWKKDVTRTGFAYRREARNDIEKGIVE